MFENLINFIKENEIKIENGIFDLGARDCRELAKLSNHFILMTLKKARIQIQELHSYSKFVKTINKYTQELQWSNLKSKLILLD